MSLQKIPKSHRDIDKEEGGERRGEKRTRKRKKRKRRRKNLELISEYSKIAKYKANIQKSIDFIYTSNEQLEFGIQNVDICITC